MHSGAQAGLFEELPDLLDCDAAYAALEAERGDVLRSIRGRGCCILRGAIPATERRVSSIRAARYDEKGLPTGRFDERGRPTYDQKRQQTAERQLRVDPGAGPGGGGRRRRSPPPRRPEREEPHLQDARLAQ